jgi:indolepyruvate ferredoxin oxidoreductase beta subunit
MTRSIKLVGVGGQGTILAAKVLCEALIEAGYDVKMSEIHGMSQRGGSVSSEIRYGQEVYSPVIERGTADVLVAFEQMEAARYIDYLAPKGTVVINNLKINSMVTLNSKVPYPKDIISALRQNNELIDVDASKMALKLGNSKVMNIVMLGVLSKTCDLSEIDIEAAIKKVVKEKFIELNIQAFRTGRDLV